MSIGKHKTTIFESEGVTRVVYHSTAVVTLDDDFFMLESGGYESVTTKKRMNQVSEEYCLGFHVYAKKFKWFVSFRGFDFPFRDGIRFNRYGFYVQDIADVPGRGIWVSAQFSDINSVRVGDMVSIGEKETAIIDIKSEGVASERITCLLLRGVRVSEVSKGQEVIIPARENGGVFK